MEAQAYQDPAVGATARRSGGKRRGHGGRWRLGRRQPKSNARRGTAARSRGRRVWRGARRVSIAGVHAFNGWVFLGGLGF